MKPARFVDIKVENGLTWFLICFSKKKHIVAFLVVVTGPVLQQLRIRYCNSYGSGIATASSNTGGLSRLTPTKKTKKIIQIQFYYKYNFSTQLTLTDAD